MDEMIEKTKLFAENSPDFTEKVVFLHAITPIIKNDMPEQITPLSTLYLLLHGAGTAVSVVLCLYLLLCRGKAIAPDITPPLGRYPLGGLRAARRYRLHGAASCLRRHAADHAAGPPSAAVAHFRRRDALRGDRCAADRPAIRRPYDPEQDLWAGHCRGLHYIYGGGRETIWAVAARQLCRPGAQGSVDQPDAAHRSHDTDHEL